MASPNPVDAPSHILNLLSNLHKVSLDQEAKLSETKKVISTKVLDDLKDASATSAGKEDSKTAFDDLMRDKFIALDEDKCQFMYQLINSMGATNVVEAGTSFGVSTIYLALAVAKVKAATGKPGTVIGTENESQKAEIARGYWKESGEIVESQINLKLGDLLETLKVDMPSQIDLLLLDSELPLPLSFGSMCFGANSCSLDSSCSSYSEAHPATSSTRWCCAH